MIEELINYINSLNPFSQGLLGSFAFAFVLWLSRALLGGMKKSGKFLYAEVSKSHIYKHIVYKQAVNSKRMADFTYGYFIVITNTLEWIIKAGLTLIFFFGVSALIQREWLEFLAYYFAFNCLFEAHLWLKDWGSEEEIKGLDEEVKKKILEKLPENPVIESSNTNENQD